MVPIATQWLTDAAEPPIELVELAVRPADHGCSLGITLHGAVMSGYADRRALLATHPRAAAAVALYRSRGWAALTLLRMPAGPRVIMSRRRTSAA